MGAAACEGLEQSGSPCTPLSRPCSTLQGALRPGDSPLDCCHQDTPCKGLSMGASALVPAQQQAQNSLYAGELAWPSQRTGLTGLPPAPLLGPAPTCAATGGRPLRPCTCTSGHFSPRGSCERSGGSVRRRPPAPALLPGTGMAGLLPGAR